MEYVEADRMAAFNGKLHALQVHYCENGQNTARCKLEIDTKADVLKQMQGMHDNNLLTRASLRS